MAKYAVIRKGVVETTSFEWDGTSPHKYKEGEELVLMTDMPDGVVVGSKRDEASGQWVAPTQPRNR